MSALRALLASGRVPFVDFGVWSVLGPRVAKFRRVETAVFTGGEFVSKILDGPASYADWENSFNLFAVSMVTLGACTPGALQHYLMGIRALTRLFPSKWSQISAADLVVRSERWTRIREDMERFPPPTFNKDMPWDAVVSTSSYGREGANSMWWHTAFVLPATLSTNIPATDGMPTKQTTVIKDKVKDKTKDRKNHTGEVCMQWNQRAGKCAGSKACPWGRLHKCSVCGGPHRAIEQHGNQNPGQSDTKSKGKGKGKKGKDRNEGNNQS